MAGVKKGKSSWANRSDRVTAGAPRAPAVRRRPSEVRKDVGESARGRDEGDGLPATVAFVEGLTFFGRGVVALHPDGRRYGRYGLIGLRKWTPDRLGVSGYDLRPDVLADATAGPPASVVVLIEVARASADFGDPARGLYPTRPAVGDRIEFGPGLVVREAARQADGLAGGYWFGVFTPHPVRAGAVDPADLYRVVDQTAAVYLKPVRPPTPVATLPTPVATLTETRVESTAVRNNRYGLSGVKVAGYTVTDPAGAVVGDFATTAAFDLCRANGWEWTIVKADGTTTKRKRSRGAYV